MITLWRYVRANLVLIAVVLIVVVGGTAAGLVLTAGPPTRTVTAYFTQTVGLYTGDQVRISGVQVGRITSIKTEGNQVKVVMAVDKSQPLPADVHAVVMAPTLVTGRYVQLTPQYQSGPTFPAGGVIQKQDTAVPVEWDAILDELNKTATALGPQGANSKGALSNLLNTSAANLNGQGSSLSATVKNLSAALTTLSDGRGDLFATVNNLDTFVSALKDSDSELTGFSQQLDNVSSVLAQNRQQLASLLTTLNQSMGVITSFINDNRSQLTTTLSSLSSLVSVINGQRQHLADLLQVAPTALSDFANIYDPVTHALTGIVAPLNGDSPQSTICGLFSNVSLDVTGCEQLLSSLSGSTPALSALIPTLSGVQRNSYCNVVTAAPGAATTDVQTQTCTPQTSTQSLLTPGASK